MLPKTLIKTATQVKKTRAQMEQYIRDQLRYNSYELRRRRLNAVKYFGVRIEITSDLKKCYVMGQLVVCLPETRIFTREFNNAVRTVLDTLVVVHNIYAY